MKGIKSIEVRKFLNSHVQFTNEFVIKLTMVGRMLHRLKQRGVLKEAMPNCVSARKRQLKRPYTIRKPKSTRPERRAMMCKLTPWA